MLTKKIREQQHNTIAPAFLYWKKGTCMEKKEINNFLSIGRGDSNLLTLEDDFVSRNHIRIEKKEAKGLFLLKDMNSQNGVFLNGSRVQQAILNNNDNIQIGKTQFTFSFERYNHKWKMASQSYNQKWNKTLNRLPHLAQSDSPILLLGPSGSGKEILAQMIHNLSKRNHEKIVSINCSALTENLVESELFGHKKGSYTGSAGTRKGAFLTAHQGTLFLDEIGDLPINLQPKLLRAIECKEVKPIGSDITLKTDARIISATHQNLKSKAEQKEFRQDLYFRLNVVTISLPSLKERMEDFEHLFKHFCLVYGVSYSSKALEIFKDYHWPGNIRELKNTIERASALFRSETLDKNKALEIIDALDEESKDREVPLWLTEKTSILKALKTYNGNQSKTSWALDIPRSTLHDRIKKYKINTKDFKTNKPSP